MYAIWDNESEEYATVYRVRERSLAGRDGGYDCSVIELFFEKKDIDKYLECWLPDTIARYKIRKVEIKEV